MALLETFVENLAEVGFYNFFLPLVLIMVVVYAVLAKSKILGENNAINTTVAVTMGLLVVGGIYLTLPVDFFAQFLSIISVILIAILGLMLLAGMFGINVDLTPDGQFNKWTVWIFLALLLIVILIVTSFFFDLGTFRINWPFGSNQTAEIITSILMLVLLGLAIWFITKKA